MVLQVGIPSGPTRELELRPDDRMDHALRVEIVQAMARSCLEQDRVPLSEVDDQFNDELKVSNVKGKNPLKDIRNTQRIHAVLTRGRVLGQAERQQMLADVEKAAHEPFPSAVRTQPRASSTAACHAGGRATISSSSACRSVGISISTGSTAATTQPSWNLVSTRANA